jgi:hypothetical protein
VFYPFQLAAFIPPLITATILPMIFALDYSDTPLGSWYVQITVSVPWAWACCWLFIEK